MVAIPGHHGGDCDDRLSDRSLAATLAALNDGEVGSTLAVGNPATVSRVVSTLGGRRRARVLGDAGASPDPVAAPEGRRARRTSSPARPGAVGAATARTLAARGNRVSLVGIEPARLLELAAELGDRHAWFEADVTDQSQINAAVAGTVERLGGIDTVVANAGIAGYGTVVQTSPEAFSRTVDINLTGAFRTAHAALPHVIEHRGYVLIVASMSSFAPLAGMGAYSASKAGADSLAAVLRQELAHRGAAAGFGAPLVDRHGHGSRRHVRPRLVPADARAAPLADARHHVGGGTPRPPSPTPSSGARAGSSFLGPPPSSNGSARS